MTTQLSSAVVQVKWPRAHADCSGCSRAWPSPLTRETGAAPPPEDDQSASSPVDGCEAALKRAFLGGADLANCVNLARGTCRNDREERRPRSTSPSGVLSP